MKRFASALLLLGSCSREPERETSPPSAASWLLAPAPAGDLVHANDTEQSLRERLGGHNIRADTIWLEEGEFAIGLILYPDDSTRRVEVQLTDSAPAHPEMVRLGNAAASVWKVAPGVGRGTSLAELERLNGRPFVLAGFEWDYAGTVTSWEGGRLDSLWQKHVILRLHLPEVSDPDLVRQVLGDVLYPSSEKAMQALNPTVLEILVRPR